MPCCKEMSKTYAKILNGLVIILGVAIVGFGVYALIEYKDILADINGFAPYAQLAFGAIVMALGVLGCWGTSYQNKPALIVYWIFMTIITIAIMAIGIAFLIYTGNMDDVKVGNSEALVGDVKAAINDFQLAVFHQCCVVPNYTNDQVLPCSDPSSGPTCIKNVDTYNDIEINNDVCTALSKVKIENIPLIGDSVTTVTLTGCSSVTGFVGLFSTYIEDNVLPIGIALIVLSTLLLLTVIFTCVLICSNRYDYDPEYRARVQNQKGGELAGTQGINYA